MGAALVILVLVGAGERTDPSTLAVAPALEHAARRPVLVTVHEVPMVPNEAEITSAAAGASADVVAEVGWRASGHEHAIVHLHGRDGQMLRSSEFVFGATEPRGERGRAIGYAIATMLDDEPVAAGILASRTAAAESEAMRESPPERPPSPAIPPPVATTAARVAPSPERPPAMVDPEKRFAVEASGSALADAGGTGAGGGPMLRLQWNASDALGLRVGAGARWFTSNGRSATELAAVTGVLWTFARSHALAAGARAELGVLRDAFTERVTRTNPQGRVLPTEGFDRTKWAPVFSLGVEGAWRPSRSTTVFVAVAAEASTRTIAASSVATASPIWAVGEAGLRFSF